MNPHLLTHETADDYVRGMVRDARAAGRQLHTVILAAEPIVEALGSKVATPDEARETATLSAATLRLATATTMTPNR